MSSDFLRSIAGSSDEECINKWIDSNFDDPENGPTVELVTEILDLQEQVKAQREWAEKKAVYSAEKLSNHLIELETLRTEKEQWENEKRYAEKSGVLKLLKVKNARHQAELLDGDIRRMEIENARIRADIEASNLNAFQTDNSLKDVLKREKKCIKRRTKHEKQMSNLQAQNDEVKQLVLQMEQRLLQAKNEAEEDEKKWKRERKEKELMVARLAEETKKADIQKANSESQMLELRQKLEADSRRLNEDLRKFEDELSCLLLSQQISDISLEENTSCESGESSKQIPSHLTCVICSKNEVSVIFLPCAHQVVCSDCFEGDCKIVEGRCPFCQVKIEESIRPYISRS